MNRTPVAQQTNTENTMPLTRGVLQRKCACGNKTAGGGVCTECAKKKHNLQRKLTIGANNDPLEREADRVADQVMAIPANSNIGNAPPRIQRFTGQSAGGIGIAPASVDRVLASAGSPLDSALQQDMGQRFGRDFSQVRVHTGSAAEQSARDVNAQAYTVGHDVVFGANRFAPETHGGQRLLAHELTHVVQQSGLDEARVGINNEKPGLSPVTYVPFLSTNSSPLGIQRESANQTTPPGSSITRLSCGPDVTDWFVAIMNSAQTDRRVLEIQRRLRGVARLGARNGYSATNVLEGGILRKLLAAERAAGRPARTTEASRQIAATDPRNEFGRALVAATVPIFGAPEQYMLAAIRGASVIWKSLVETNAVWDFKNNVLSGARLSAASCPSPCPNPPTVTLCNACHEHDLPGNIFYAFVGRICGFSRNALQLGSQYAEILPSSSGGWDPPEDTAAINLGFGLQTTLTQSNLCSALSSARGSVTTRSCETCPVTYSP